MKFIKRNIAAVIVAAMVLGAGGAVYAGQPERPTTAETGTAAPEGGGARRAGKLARRAIHADVVVRGTDGFQNVTIDRGKLRAVDADQLTIDRQDGTAVTVTLTDTTRYRGLAGKDALVVGKPTVVVSKDGTAVVIGQPQPRSATHRNAAASGTVQ